MSQNVYEYTVKDKSGKDVSLERFSGKVLLIVNTASKCGFTPQYEGLQKLYDKYSGRGLEILAFPCNQFGFQEPGSDEKIQEFCRLNYGVTFSVYSKIRVNGKEAHPLYKFLKEGVSEKRGQRIKWNFTKFLIDRKGNVVSRFDSSVKPEQLKEDIEKLL